MTGKVLLARQPDWRVRQRQASVAASPPAWQRRERVEFDEPEPDHAGSDGGWTVGYLDVLLLLVTLFAALLGATYLQMSQLRSAQAPEIQPLAAFAPPVQQSPTTTPAPELASNVAETRAAPVGESKPNAEPAPVPALSEESRLAKTLVPAPQVQPEQTAESGAGHPETSAPAAGDPSRVPLVHAAAAQPESEPTVPPQFIAMMELVAAHAERQGLELLLDRHQLRLEVGDGILFDSGTADLGPAGRALIEELVTALEADRLEISVEGHTDDVPINTPRFPSNWELSSIRATTVARELIEHGIPQHRIRVTGFADTRPRAPNDTAANRALNRRVSLVLEVSEEVLAGSY